MNSRVIHLDEAAYYGLPEATTEQPFAQLTWIFEQRLSRVSSKEGKANYRYALSFYLRFLQETEGVAPFAIKKRWDSLALVRFRTWLLTQEKDNSTQFGSHTLTGIVSAVRQVMTEAIILEVAATRDIIDISMPQAHRDTDMHAPYNSDEIAGILEAVKEDLRYTNAVLAGYKPTGTGRDPQVRPEPSLRINPQKYAEHGYGWNCEANMRWYFEHRMNCRAMSRTDDEGGDHKVFFSGAQRYHGGYMAVYKRWGVTPQIDRDILWPLVIQLSYLTGLNPSSLMGLEATCLAEHPLTGTPVLRYLKLRSKGEKELLVDLLNEDESNLEEDFEEAELPLKRQHAVLVQRVIEKILRLTQPIREHTDFPPHLKNSLFVYQSSGNNCHGEFQALPVWKMNQWCHEMGERHNLRSSSGAPLSFSLVRFRPTRLTEMAAKGKDFFEIQHVAGHKSIKTTLAYIEQRTLDAVAEREVTDALERIWSNREEFCPSNPLEQRPAPSVPFKGLVSDCKNVFDPPRPVQLAADYVAGQACTRFNMCLLCKNIVIMKEHLPVLAHYRNQIRAATTNTGVDLPHIALYEKSLAVLDQIFDPDTSEFSEDDLDEGIEAAELLDVVIDSLVYSGSEK
jgi:integrase